MLRAAAGNKAATALLGSAESSSNTVATEFNI